MSAIWNDALRNYFATQYQQQDSGSGAGGGSSNTGSANSGGKSGNSGDAGNGADGEPDSGENDGAEPDPEWKIPTTQAEVDALIQKAKGQVRRSERESIRAELVAESEREKLRSDGDLAKLNAQLEKDLLAANEKLREYDRSEARRTAAEKVGIPIELADRINGDDEESMIEDAKRLKKLIPSVKVAPRTDGGNGSDGAENDGGGNANVGTKTKRSEPVEPGFTRDGRPKKVWPNRRAG
jgi:hypothetical protein